MNMNITYVTATSEADNKARVAALIASIKAEEIVYSTLIAEVLADPQTVDGIAKPNDLRTTAVVQSTNRMDAYWNELNALRNRTLDNADYVAQAAWHVGL